MRVVVEGVLAFFMTGGLIGYLGLEGRASGAVRRVCLTVSLVGVVLGILWSPRFLIYVGAAAFFGGIITYSRIAGDEEETASMELERRKMVSKGSVPYR
ncbi:hypothetical protein [Desmospora profundinema]|uniref:Uncharacterized protein n=1 Tax=Desmospora profundinema TaxID=1571184 RepID=A0ABU1IR98_9BACL|nr:hypothetical protein [Desmospora profundinema]MDR6227077.1 hypothetical protein [Desmospora profundinema]